MHVMCMRILIQYMQIKTAVSDAITQHDEFLLIEVVNDCLYCFDQHCCVPWIWSTRINIERLQCLLKCMNYHVGVDGENVVQATLLSHMRRLLCVRAGNLRMA